MAAKRVLIIAGLTGVLISTIVHGQADIAARVNGTVIPRALLEEAVDEIIPRATFHGALSDDRRQELREKALEALIIAELQYQDALALGMKVDSGLVKDQMKRVRDSFRSSKDYQLWLEKKRMSEDQLRARIERSLLVRTAVEKHVEEPSRLSEQELRDFYDANPEHFKETESVHVRIISTKSETKLNDILGKLKTGEDFGSIASRMSDDGYRVKGGDIGFVKRGMIYPALEERAFSLKPGNRSDVLMVDGTFYLVKVEEYRPSRIIPFSEAREDIKKDQEKKRRSVLLDKWLTSLRAKADIQVIIGDIETKNDSKNKLH
ncbi:MAG: peptidyl-prolyl cis-trans isomerase [Nitrospirota bacterium]|nr:peptidyl-prolyl cis-trans isomerase [Nitrospirota bacterium]